MGGGGGSGGVRGGWGGWGVGWGGRGFLRHSPCRSHRQAGPSTASVCSSSKGLGGVPRGGGGGGGVKKFGMGGRVGLGGRRPDPGLLVPDASRQEAEANIGGKYHRHALFFCGAAFRPSRNL